MSKRPAAAGAEVAAAERDVLLATKLNVPGPRPGFVPAGRVELAGFGCRVGAQLELSRARLRTAAADAFRVRLIDALRGATDGGEAEARATLLLLEHLRCARVSYGEIEDGCTLAVHAAAAAHGAAAGTSRWDLTRWHTAEVRADLEAGRPVVIDDVRSDPRITAQTRASYAERDAGSLVQAPIVRDGRLVAMLLAQDSGPRQCGTTKYH